MATYKIHEPGNLDEQLLAEVLGKHGLDASHPVSMLPFGQIDGPEGTTYKIGAETRRLYFNFAVQNGRLLDGTELAQSSEQWQEAPVTRIISWGKCNVACPYCKRDCQFLGDDGKPIISQMIPLRDVAALCEGAVARGEIVRFSGGDPVSFPRETLALSEYLYRRHGTKSSIAHNGTGPAMVKKLAPYLSSAAIDLKGVPEKIGGIMGRPPQMGPRFYALSLETQALVSGSGVLLDVRTPVFGDTTLDEMRRLAQDIYRVNDIHHTFWTWRMYKPVLGCDWVAPEREPVLEMMKTISAEVPNLWLGIRAKWERGGMIYVKDGAIRQKTADSVLVVPVELGSGNQISAAA